MPDEKSFGIFCCDVYQEYSCLNIPIFDLKIIRKILLKGTYDERLVFIIQGIYMQYVQAKGDLYMAIHINKVLYEKGTIPYDMYSKANQVFQERLYKLEREGAEGLNETA